MKVLNKVRIMRFAMAAKQSGSICGMICVMLCAGCGTTRTVPPLYSEMPKIDMPDAPRLLAVPVPPPHQSIPIIINVPKKETAITTENAIMRKGATIKAGDSVVISVPASAQQIMDRARRTSDMPPIDEKGAVGFMTDGYFNLLEQHVERELISKGLYVKDRSKFEAKLRDLRDRKSGPVMGPDQAGDAAGKREKQSTAGWEGMLEKGLNTLGSLSTLLTGGGKREELADTAEVVRAAQDGEVQADYILQIHDLSVKNYSGEPLQLAKRPEVQAVVNANPGLRVGAGESTATGDSLPAELRQPWMMGHFNAKLINVKTGNIEWIGDYSVDSPTVLEEGLTIMIGVRRATLNGKEIVAAITAHNANLVSMRERIDGMKRELEGAYRKAMKPVEYRGAVYEGDYIQSRRKTTIATMEVSYANLIAAYGTICRESPSEEKADWTYVYVVDKPTVTPDLSMPVTEEDHQRLMQHVKAVGTRISKDLLGTIEITN